MVKKSEIFGKRATILRTKNGGRYFRFIKKNGNYILQKHFLRREVIQAMVVSAQEVASNPAFALLRDRERVSQSNPGVLNTLLYSYTIRLYDSLINLNLTTCFNLSSNHTEDHPLQFKQGILPTVAVIHH